MTVTAGGALTADAGEGAAIGSGAAGFVIDSFAADALSVGAGEAGNADFAGCAVRFVAFRTDGFTGGSVGGRVSTTRRAAAAARGAGAVAVGNGPGATSAENSRGSGACCEGPLAGGRCGIATVAITSTAIPASVTICPRVGCHDGVGCVTGTVRLAEADSTAVCSAMTRAAAGTSVAGVADVTESFACGSFERDDGLARLAAGLARCRLFAGFFARGRFSASTSADTSNVQRTRRPDWRGESLIGCFGTQPKGATHVPRGSRESLHDRRSGRYRTVSRLSTVAAIAGARGAGGGRKASHVERDVVNAEPFETPGLELTLLWEEADPHRIKVR